MGKPWNKSFKQWCIENEKEDILNIWDYELNKCTPNEIGYGSNKKYYFKCKNNLHKSELKNINNLSHNRPIVCNQCNSFGQWCLDNNHLNWLDLWDYKLNTINPFEIEKCSNQRIYFKCENNCHESRLVKISKINTKNKIPKCKKCNSFGVWCVENNKLNILNRWDYKLNNISPFDVSRSSDYKAYFKCERNLHESEAVVLYSILSKNTIKCSKCNSIAQYLIDTYGFDALEKYWDYEKNTISPWKINKGSSKDIWIKCQKVNYHESYKTFANTFTKGINFCPYCNNQKIHYLDSLGYIYPIVISLWSDKNEKSPYKYSPMSSQKLWWKCPEGKHEDYLRSIYGSQKCNFRCPECTRERNESILQEKVRLYITEKYGYKLNHEYNCTIIPCNPKYNGNQGHMPFDNEIEDLKLIIEVNGEQHYNTKAYSGIWGNKKLTPEQQLHKQQLHDRYKKYIAYINGYNYLEIPYWTDDKNETYKKLIDDKIKEICKLSA